MQEHYVYKDQKKLRCGYTTGTCATAAVRAAVEMLFTNKKVESVEVNTPKGRTLQLSICKIQMGETVSCAVKKDSGDDADVTNGIYIYAAVHKISSKREHEILIDGGIGIGRVTKKGLEQPVGSAAINSVPRGMIANVVLESMEKYNYEEGISVMISAPEGVEIAKRTFNERLGIIGGISILGTSGIVEPMSEQALVDTIRVELRQKIVQGHRDLLVVPGNYGEKFVKDNLQIDVNQAIKCSNFVGETLDMACEYKVRSLLLIGNIGKLVKLGAGIMNTHSKMADGRMEVLAACGILADLPIEGVRKILACINTDEAIGIMLEYNRLKPVMEILMKKITYHLEHRVQKVFQIEVITFSNQYGMLGMTNGAKDLLQLQQNML